MKKTLVTLAVSCTILLVTASSKAGDFGKGVQASMTKLVSGNVLTSGKTRCAGGLVLGMSEGGIVPVYGPDGKFSFHIAHAGAVSEDLVSPSGTAVVGVDKVGCCRIYDGEGVLKQTVSRRGIVAAAFLPTEQDTVVLLNHRFLFFKNAQSNRLVKSRISSTSGFSSVILKCLGNKTTVCAVDGRGRPAMWDGNTGKRLGSRN